MYKNDAGYVVKCRRGEEYFGEASKALEYADFWAALGYDALVYKVQIQGDESWLQKIDEDYLRASEASVI